jgi:hypothetical protein
MGVQELIPAGNKNMLFSFGGTAVDNSGLLFILLGYTYLSGVLFMLFRSVKSLAYVRELQKSGTRPGVDWQEKIRSLCESLGIKRSVNFLESKLVSAPQLVTLLKPAVIVPAGMLTNLPASQIETILLHELYHLKRKDFLVNLIQILIEGVLFYHPVVWFISANIRREREHCCDDKVLVSTDNPLEYAKALIQVAEQQHFTRLAPGAVGSGKHQFNSRIRRILNQNTMKTNMSGKVLTMSLLAGSLIILLTISGFNRAPAFISTNDMRAGVQTTLVDPILHVTQDTIPEEAEEEKIQEPEEPDWEAIREEIELAHQEALKEIEEIDWESIKEEMELARQEALKEIEEIDWDALKEDMKEAREEALKEIEEIDWESIKEEMEIAREEALKEIEEIDWESIKADLDLDFSEMKMEIESSLKDIDWDDIREDIREDLEEARIYLDSIRLEMDR